MPAVAKTSPEAILATAHLLLEQGGADAVTMHAIARAVGIRAPSLYKHFSDRAAVMEQLALQGFTDLAERMAEASHADDPFTAMAVAYRAAAHAAPRRYLHMMSAEASTSATVDAARRRAAVPVLDLLRPLVGAERALSVARLLTAFLHGFVTMELAGAFRLGGDPAQDFTEGVHLLREMVERTDAPG